VWREGKLNGYLAVYRVELRVDGELAPGWLIGSGYAYNLTRYILTCTTREQMFFPRHQRLHIF
jgi:hypothetical protein